MQATLTANWSYPTRVLVGPGRLAELGAACKSAGIARPLIVTDKGLAEGQVIAKAGAALKEAGLPVAVFSDVRGNPTEANVKAGLAAFRSGSHDGVVAIGGGSALDVGKTVAFMNGQTRRSGISRISATGGRGPTRRASRRSSPCRRRRARARRSAAPRS